jgi:hypothetical protein
MPASVNYLKLEKTLVDRRLDADSRALRAGNFFATTGEILIRNYAVTGTGARER